MHASSWIKKHLSCAEFCWVVYYRNSKTRLLLYHRRLTLGQDGRTDKLAWNLVHWIVLTEQWPYRMSYILQVIEDADQRAAGARNGEKIPDSISRVIFTSKFVIV